MQVVVNDGSALGVPGDVPDDTAPTGALTAPIRDGRDIERHKK